MKFQSLHLFVKEHDLMPLMLRQSQRGHASSCPWQCHQCFKQCYEASGQTCA